MNLPEQDSDIKLRRKAIAAANLILANFNGQTCDVPNRLSFYISRDWEDNAQLIAVDEKSKQRLEVPADLLQGFFAHLMELTS